MTKIKTYLIHGSLGAGKTTILNTILADPNFDKSIVIENEFANFSVDEYLINSEERHNHKTHNIVGGCICCSSGTELLEILEEISKKKNIKKLIIETTGVANSVDLIKQLILSSTFDDNFELTKNILVVDSFEENIDELFKNNGLDIKIADIIILTKTDISDKAKINKFVDLLKGIGNKNIVKVVNGKFDTSILIDNNKSGSTRKILDNIDLFALPSVSHTDNNYYQVLNLKKDLNIKTLTTIINAINLRKDVSIKRVKGFLKDGVEEYIVNGTPNAINYIKPQSKIDKMILVLIGNKVTKEVVTKYFKEYV